MTAAQISALVTAIVALAGAVSSVLAQISHIRWHRLNPSPPAASAPPAAPVPPASS